MSLCRLLRRTATTPTTITRSLHHLTLSPTTPNPQSSNFISPPPFTRLFAYSSAEEAAAERRRRKRRLRIEPPLHALQRNPNPPPRDPNAPRLPDSTSALVGPRLNLHNRVQSLIRAFDLDNASLLARNAVYSRTRPTVFTCNAIIAAMYRAKRYDDAISLFKYFFEQHNIVPNVVSYNNLINAHCDEGRVDDGLEIYKHIIANAPFSPSPVSYRHLTKGLIDAGRVEDAVDLLREMLNKGHGADSLVYNNLIKAYLELGNLDRADEFFTELTERCLWYDATINATYMEWWFKQGKNKEGMENYKSFLDRKLKIPPPTGNALLEVLLKYGKKEAADNMFELLLDNHTPPTNQGVNSETISIMVNHCFKEGKFDEVVSTFRKAGTKPGSKPFQMDVAGYNNIIVKFAENGMLSEAETFFTELCSKSLSPDVTSYRTFIDAYLKVERIDDALRFLNKMVQENLWVVANYATRVFGELIKNGKAVDCYLILTKMGERDPKPDPSVYDVVIRGLCDAGALEESKDLLEQMMKYGVGVPPALKEFATEMFTNAGRNQEMVEVFDEKRWRNFSAPPHVQRQPRMPWGSPQMGRDPSSSFPGQTSRGQPQMAGQQSTSFRGQTFSGQSQIGRQQQYSFPGQAPPNHQMARQQSFGHQQLAGQQASGSHNSSPQHSSWLPHIGQQPSGYQQTAGHQPSGYQQTVGHQPSGYQQTAGHQPSWSSHIGQQPSGHQTAGHQSAWSSRTGQQPSGNQQTAGHQPSWSSQVGLQSLVSSHVREQQPSSDNSLGQQSSRPHQMEGQQFSWPYQMGGQQPSWSSHMGGQQPSWSSRMGGQQPLSSSQMGGQQSSWSSQMGVQQPSWSSQMVGQQPSEATHLARQQPHEPQRMSGQFESLTRQQPNGPQDTSGQQSPEPVEWQDNYRRAAV